MPATSEEEQPAELYLHKIVQTTIPLPALSRFDTQAYLFLLQLQAGFTDAQLAPMIEQCAELRRRGASLDEISFPEGADLTAELAFASRLTPLLYEKLHGNPRRVKRFLNDLRVRQTIANRRGIHLQPPIVAKLMVLEVLLPDDFARVLDWLAQGELRTQIEALEVAAGRQQAAVEPTDARDHQLGAKSPHPAASATPHADAPVGFSEGQLRWAKLPPALSGVDLAPYLYLAASFSGITLLDTSLPERLRDIAANLLSSSRGDREAVTDVDLDGLSGQETDALLRHIGRTIRDQPSRQKTGVNAVLRMARRRPEAVASARDALKLLPAGDVTVATPLLLKPDDASELFDVLTEWSKSEIDPRVQKAIQDALNNRGRK